MNMDRRQKEAYALACEEIGLKELRGAEHNPDIVEMFADVGHSWVKDDETAWCAAFVGSMLARAGLPSTRKLDARSYLKWGMSVDPRDAQIGDIVVFWRQSPTSWQGHVGFFAGRDGDYIKVLGGNQSNSVSIAAYPMSRLLGVRRMTVANDPEPPSWIESLIAALKRMFQ